MPDRYEDKRNELIKGGMSYLEAQVAKEPQVDNIEPDVAEPTKPVNPPKKKK